MTRAYLPIQPLAALLVIRLRRQLRAADATATKPADKSADKSTAKSPSQRWESDIAAFEAADKKSPPPQGAVLFIGSSSIRIWKTLATDFPDQKTINRGFGGSELADSVYYADRIVIPYKPRLIVLFAGTNDINAGKRPETVFADFKAFVAKVRAGLPNTRIAYLSISPAPIPLVASREAKRSEPAHQRLHRQREKQPRLHRPVGPIFGPRRQTARRSVPRRPLAQQRRRLQNPRRRRPAASRSHGRDEARRQLTTKSRE